MPQNSVDLASIFQTVTQALAENQQNLNQADGYNQDHGNNMVQTFQTITGALQQKKGASDSAALAYAAKQLSQNAGSGSGRTYAQNLTQASEQFKGQKVDSQGAMQLLQTLIGSGQTQSTGQPAGGDMLSSLLGGLTGGTEPSAPQASQAGGDVLSSLLGSLTGGASSSPGGQYAASMGNLLDAGLAFLQARQSGGSNAQALVQAFMAGSGMGNTPHRAQSTQVVVSSFLQALSSMHSQP
jgi:hypothetical protein